LFQLFQAIPLKDRVNHHGFVSLPGFDKFLHVINISDASLLVKKTVEMSLFLLIVVPPLPARRSQLLFLCHTIHPEAPDTQSLARQEFKNSNVTTTHHSILRLFERNHKVNFNDKGRKTLAFFFLWMVRTNWKMPTLRR
jgi:hypothetical protein